MNISPINFNNIFNRQKIIPRAALIAFGQETPIEDKYQPKARIHNSMHLLKAIKEHKYTDARSLLQIAADDFDPNFKDMSGMSLIGALYIPRKEGDADKGGSKYKLEIMYRIFDHPDFDPNQAYTDENGKKRYYIEDAAEHNDRNLALLLSQQPEGIKDPNYDDFETLENATTDPNIRYIISQLALCLGTQTVVRGAVPQKIKETKEAGDADKEIFYESDFVKKFRTNLPDNTPSNLSEIGGMKEAKKAINDFIIVPWQPDIRQKLRENEIELPNGFLMYGPPGCGKTYLAQIIAKQTGFPMYSIDLSGIGSSAGYETANNIRNIFEDLEKQYAKNHTPSILFLDEIDSIAASRADSHTDWKKDDVNALITQLNNAGEKGIIVIGATNFLDNVDKAVLRPGRFDKKIKIELPNKEERKEIIQKISARKRVATELYNCADELAQKTEDKSPSEISSAINDCCRRAIGEGKSSVTKEDFLNSLKQLEDEATRSHRVIGFSQ